MNQLKLSELLKIRESITSVTKALEDLSEPLKELLKLESFKIKENLTQNLFKSLDLLNLNILKAKINQIDNDHLIEEIKKLNEYAKKLRKVEKEFFNELDHSKQSLARYEWLVNSNLITIQTQISEVGKDVENIINKKFEELSISFINLEFLVDNNIILHKPVGANIIEKELDSLKDMILNGVIKEEFSKFETQTRSMSDEIQKKSAKIGSTKLKDITDLMPESIRREVVRDFFDTERSKSMIKTIDSLNTSMQLISKTIEHYIQVSRTELIRQYNKDNDIRNNKSMKYSFPNEADYYFNRASFTNLEIVDKMPGIIGKSVDWRFPIAYIEPNSASLFSTLVAGDPFYWIDDYSLPYEKLRSKTNPINYKKVLQYTKKQAEEFIKPNNIGMCVNWNNFFYSPIFEIKKEIKFMSDLVMPGGIVMFDFIDIYSSRGADAVETYGFVPSDFDLIEKICEENDLVLENRLDYDFYMSTIVLYRKKGNMPATNLSGKLGIVQDKT